MKRSPLLNISQATWLLFVLLLLCLSPVGKGAFAEKQRSYHGHSLSSQKQATHLDHRLIWDDNLSEQIFIEEEDEEHDGCSYIFLGLPSEPCYPVVDCLVLGITQTSFTHSPYPFYILYKRLKLDLV